MPKPFCLCNGAATSNSQHGGFWGCVRTNLGAGLLVATSARPASTVRGAPRERHEDEYWVVDSGATENMTQDSSNLEDYTPPPPGDEVKSAGRVFLPVAGYGRLRLLVDHDNGNFKEATRKLTLDRVAHVPKLGRHNLLSTKRLTAAFDAPMRVYSAAASIRPRLGRSDRFSLLRPRKWPPQNQGPPSRRDEGTANAANDSSIDGDGQDQPPSHHGVS